MVVPLKGNDLEGTMPDGTGQRQSLGNSQCAPDVDQEAHRKLWLEGIARKR